MKAAKSLYLALLAVLLTPMASNAIPISINGADYEVTTVVSTFNDLETELTAQVWWGNREIADGFAALIQDSLATTDGGVGPIFAWTRDREDDEIFGASYWRVSTTSVVSFGFRTGESLTFAIIERAAVHEPGTLALLGLGLVGMAARRRGKTASI